MTRRLSLGLTVVAASIAAPPMDAQEDTVVVEAVIRLDIEHGPSGIVPAMAADSRLLLPLVRLLELVEVGAARIADSHFVTAVLEPAGIAIRFDTDAMLLTVEDSTMPLGRFDAVWRDGDLFVDTGVLAYALGVAVAVDWEGLTAVVGQTDGLPVARRARRERRRALAFRRRPGLPQPVLAPVRDRVADGAVFEWSFTAATNAPLDNLSAELGFGAKLAGGGLEAQHEQHRLPGGTLSETRVSWMRAWPERPWLRQVRVGDVASGGRRSRMLRGVVATNQPFIRSSEFDLEEIVGELPAGWEIELYDAYGLLDFGEADPLGEYRVALPLRYGQNPFDMVLYGPRGEVVRRHRTIRVPFTRLPAGQVEYAIGLGDCRTEPCRAAFTTDVRYGVSRRITAQAGWDLLARPDESALWQPYLAVSAAALPALNLTGEAVYHGLLRGQAEYEPTPDLRFQLSQTFFSAKGGRLVGAASDRERTEGSLLWFTNGRTATAVQVSGSRATGGGSARSAFRTLVTVRRAGRRFGLEARHLRVAPPSAPTVTQTVFDLSADIVLRHVPEILHAATIGGGVGVEPTRGLSSIRGTLSRAVARTVRIDIGVGWFRMQGGLALDVGFSTALPGPRFGSRNRFSREFGTEGLQFADGSILWDRESRRVQFGDGRDLGRAGIAGAVFLDIDADGMRDADEPGLPGVPVRVDGWALETDAEGRFSTWELFPFQPAVLAVDTTALGNPFYVVTHRIVEVTPTPNSFVAVELPVMIGAEVSGGVLFAGRPLAGVRVRLRETRTGRVITLTTFRDGGFYTIGVPPGDYEASIPASTLRRLGATAAPVTFTVPAGPGEKLIEAVVLTVERTP